MLQPVALGLLAVLLTGLLTAMAVLGRAGSAGPGLRSAHPAPGVAVAQPPERIELLLDRPWSGGSTTSVSVVGPTDRDLARGRPSATAGGLSQRVAAAPESGAYQVSYRVRTTDGQLATGSYWFVYTPPALADQRRVAAVGGLAVLLVLLTMALGRRRRSRPRLDGAPAREARRAPVGEQPSGPRVPRQRDRSNVERVPPPTAPESGPNPGTGRSPRGRGSDSPPGRSLGRPD